MLKKVLLILIVSLLAVFLIIIKIDPAFLHTLTSQDNNIKVGKGHSKEEQSPYNTQHKDNLREVTFPFEDKKHEAFAKKYPDQFNIVKKMFYSWDYIHNAQGEFEMGIPNVDITRGQFYVNLDEKKNSSKIETVRDGKVVETENVLLKNGLAIHEFPKKGIYTKKSIDHPEDQYLGFGNGVITESEWWSLIYNEYPDWSYKVTTKDGLPVYQIKGEITTSESLAGRFTMTVSKETGALLDLKCYGHGKSVIYFVTGKDIQINKDVQDDVFKLDITGDKKLSFKEYNQRSYGYNAVKDKK